MEYGVATGYTKQCARLLEKVVNLEQTGLSSSPIFVACAQRSLELMSGVLRFAHSAHPRASR